MVVGAQVYVYAEGQIKHSDAIPCKSAFQLLKNVYSIIFLFKSDRVVFGNVIQWLHTPLVWLTHTHTHKRARMHAYYCQYLSIASVVNERKHVLSWHNCMLFCFSIPAVCFNCEQPLSSSTLNCV
jgi:hypothetical protein